MVLLSLLAVVTIGIVRLRNLFAIVILSGIYSFLMASVMIVLDAVDVAMTEASVGAGISTVLLLGTLALTSRREKVPGRTPVLPLIVVLITGAALLYGTLDMPRFGDPDAPIQRHVAPRYIQESGTEIGVPNIVTSVLASYRGFDTLGEVTVIFTAGIGILLLLGGTGGRRRKDEETEEEG